MKELVKRLWNNPETVRKFVVALLGAVLVAVSQGLLDAAVGSWVSVALSFITALGVYVVPNDRLTSKHDK